MSAEPRTKIVCTLGPASRDPAVLRALFEAGADVMRLNGAHVTRDEVAPWVEAVREAAGATGRLPAVLVDLPGTKVRVGALPEPMHLEAGAEVALVAADRAEGPGTIPMRATIQLSEVPVGSPVVLGDGQVRLEVLGQQRGRLRARVLEGGEVRSGMGVGLAPSALPAPVPTSRDRELARAVVEAGADMLALSFVRTLDDVVRLKDVLADLGARATPVVAKIERMGAVENLDRILTRADAVMVARGDLGLAAGPERVPSLQRRILEAARRAGRPVVVATEMLESMTRAARPTRAEASDVAGAVFEGADAVMLSAETSVGAHPALVVRTMARILRAAEEDPGAPYAGNTVLPPLGHRAGRPDQHVVRAAVALAEETRALAIVVFTRTGMSAVRLSKERPRALVHAFAPSEETCRRLALAWGVRARRLPAARSTDEVEAEVIEQLAGPGGLSRGDRAVLVMGGAKDPAGATTLIKLLTL